ncbi:hypothetical protein MBLNU13_g05245t1 [Cladosporium sp. NU13]
MAELTATPSESLFDAVTGPRRQLKKLLDRSIDVDIRDPKTGQTPLFRAIDYGEIGAARLLIKAKADVNAHDHSGLTLLSLATQRGCEASIIKLLAAGADPNAQDGLHGRTMLSLAAEEGSAEVVRALLARGVHVDAVDTSGRSPLSWAAANGHARCVLVLLRQHADTEIRDMLNSWTPLEWAIERKHKSVVQIITRHVIECKKQTLGLRLAPSDGRRLEALRIAFATSKTQPTSETFSSGELLLWTIKDAREDEALFLIQCGASFCSQDDEGMTALSHAASLGQSTVVRALLGGNIESDQVDAFGRTPLSWAAGNGHVEVSELLIDNNANVNREDESRWTPLMYAAERGLESIGRLLLDNGANPNSCSDRGWTPLHAAASAGCAALVSRLLDAGADPSAQEELGELTAISKAAENGDMAVVELLLARGVSPNIDGKTLICALDHLSGTLNDEDYALIHTLVKHGADVFMNLWTDARPLEISARRGYGKIVSLFLQAEFTSSETRQQHIEDAVCAAAENGEEEILKMLMEHYSRSGPTGERDAPWQWARTFEFGESLKLLRPYFDLTLRDDHHFDVRTGV